MLKKIVCLLLSITLILIVNSATFEESNKTKCFPPNRERTTISDYNIKDNPDSTEHLGCKLTADSGGPLALFNQLCETTTIDPQQVTVIISWRDVWIRCKEVYCNVYDTINDTFIYREEEKNNKTRETSTG